MARIYVRTADPAPSRWLLRRQKLHAARQEKMAEYACLRRRHDKRAQVARQLVEITSALIAAELKTSQPAAGPAQPAPDLFAD